MNIIEIEDSILNILNKEIPNQDELMIKILQSLIDRIEDFNLED